MELNEVSPCTLSVNPKAEENLMVFMSAVKKY
jgi:hypothetical protein